MSDDSLIRITSDGEPLNDAWSNYRRRHNFVVLGRVTEQVEEDFHRVWIFCTRCGQTRKVWHMSSLTVDGRSWGCPRMPWQYRVWLRMQGRPIPTWDVNEPPPWWAGP